GRAFCGWLCPLGTACDGVRRIAAPVTGRVQARLARRSGGWTDWLAHGPLMVLIIGVIALVLGLPLLGALVPTTVLERAAATALTPWASDATARATQPAAEREPPSGFLAEDFHFIGAPVRATAASHAAWGVGLGLLALILAAETVMPRAWCRTLCPSGAALGLLARWSLVRRLPGRTCGTCRSCVDRCHMGAFTADGRLIPSACSACWSCVAVCPSGAARVAAAPGPAGAAAGPDLTRRGLLAAGVAGCALPLVRHLDPPADPHRLRPPGVAQAGDDDRFLDACVRCGACVQACPTHGLTPALLADGLGGLLAPRLEPRLGPCERGCTACAAVCPTGAIPRLPLGEKQVTRIGLAVHDHRRCLPWSGGGECRACWEHCPVPDKAITLRLGRAANGQAVPLPGVEAERCTGCGTCEFVCPIDGAAGIRVAARDQAAGVRARLQPGAIP
ncbi:MAG: hypothetical protein RLZZ127_2154, partial [Planctomycetota bacterium]